MKRNNPPESGARWSGRQRVARVIVVAAALVIGIAGCVGLDPGAAEPRGGARPAGLGSATPAVRAALPAPTRTAERIDADDDRLVRALAAGAAPAAPRSAPGPETAVPPARDAIPRIEPIRQGAPNRPYVIDDERYVPIAQDLPMRETGVASWYGEPFHGRRTANGEVYDMHTMTAAHPTMPLPSYALVRHLANGREIIVRINDRGPFVGGRVIDLSLAAARRLGIEGIARVEVVRLTHDDIRHGRWRDPAVRLASADRVTRR